jgi:hypothetical protein
MSRGLEGILRSLRHEPDFSGRCTGVDKSKQWFVERYSYQMFLTEMSSYDIDYNAAFGV